MFSISFLLLQLPLGSRCRDESKHVSAGGCGSRSSPVSFGKVTPPPQVGPFPRQVWCSGLCTRPLMGDAAPVCQTPGTPGYIGSCPGCQGAHSVWGEAGIRTDHVSTARSALGLPAGRCWPRGMRARSSSGAKGASAEGGIPDGMRSSPSP